MSNKSHSDGGEAVQDGPESGAETVRRGRRSETDRTTEIMATLPVGIKLGQRTDGRPKPWFVRWGPQRTVESFASARERNDRAEELIDQREKHGADSLRVDMAEYRAWRDFRARCAAPLHELETAWKQWSAGRLTLTADAVQRFMDTRREDEPHYSHLKLHLKRVRDEFGPLPLADVTPDLLRELSGKLVGARTGKPVSDVTRYDYRKTWSLFFDWAVTARLLAHNPCDLFTLPRPGENERDILTARQIFELLKVNLAERVVGRMAFELFGGMRASSVGRMTAEHVKRDVRGIRMPGPLHKSKKTKFRQGHPEVLWAWHDHAGDAMWGFGERAYNDRKADAFTRARVPNPGNVLRNSFATYMLAATNNPPLVARLMQHTSLRMLEIYEGVGTEQDAKLVLAMTPAAAALEWDDFVKANPPAPSADK